MQTIIEAGIPSNDWDDKLLALGGHITQSTAWAHFAQALGRKNHYASDNGWMWLAQLRHGRGVSYLNAPYGPTVASAAALADSLKYLDVLARGEGAMFVRLEPCGPLKSNDLASAGLRQFDEVQPEHTHVLDLTQPVEQLRSGLESGHRNRVNGAERRGITVRVAKPTEINIFLDMMRDTANFNKIKNFDDSYYRTLVNTLEPRGNAAFYIAEHEGSPVSSAIALDWGHTRYYAFAAADQARNRKIGASVVLVWQMILDARAAGKSEFDFWGVAPADDTNHKWAGLSAFKRGFGGVDKSYHGTWDLPVKSTQYKLYRGLKRYI